MSVECKLLWLQCLLKSKFVPMSKATPSFAAAEASVSRVSQPTESSKTKATNLVELLGKSSGPASQKAAQNQTAIPSEQHPASSLSEQEKSASTAVESNDAGTPYAMVQLVAVEDIELSPYQMRRNIDADSLEDLKNSIIAKGILQPLLVRANSVTESNKTYELVAGERRLRAAKAAMMQEVPVLIVALDDRETLEAAFIENAQREI